MISRKKKIILIQITIFLVASTLLYNTYRDKNKNTKEVKIEVENNPDTNNFTNIEYSGFDLRGNRYVLQAGEADFKTVSPGLINMKEVVANFYLDDETILTVISDEGTYNNVTSDIKFMENVTATYLTNTLLSDQLNYSNSNAKLIASGNVRGESIEKGRFIADNVEYSLTNKTLDFSMFGDKQINVKVKN